MMSTLISLVGEQPEPVIIPSKFIGAEKNILVHTDDTETVASRLAKQLANSEMVCTAPYDYRETFDDIMGSLKNETHCIFNLTGGTKIMVLAGYASAIQKNSAIIYYRSQGHVNILHTLEVANGVVISTHEKKVPAEINKSPLLDCDAFLKTYLGDYIQEKKAESKDYFFEMAIFNALGKDENLEILKNIRPAGEKQIEIDLVIRRGLQFAIAEIKAGSIEGDTVKKGIDQLSTAGSREYLGTYTTKILILGRSVQSMCSFYEQEIRDLALAKRVHIVEIKNYIGDKDYLSLDQAKLLRKRINEILK